MKVFNVVTDSMSLIFFRGHQAVLLRNGIDATFVCSPGEFAKRFARTECAHVVTIPMQREIAPIRDVYSLCNLVRLFFREKPDLVASHTPKAGLLATAAAWLTRVPRRVYHVHGLPLETATGLRRRILKLTERLACMFATEVLAVSHSVANQLRAREICHNSRLDVLGRGSLSGIDCMRFARRSIAERNDLRSKYSLSNDRIVVGFVGRFVRDKGILELARAWQLVAAARPESLLVMVGTVDGDRTVEGALEGLQRSESCRFLGQIEEIPNAYNLMDLLVLPTYREGLSTVLAEAGASSLPVVTTNATGCIDIVMDGQTGAIVPVGSVEELARRLIEYIDNGGLRERHGAAARKLILSNFEQSLVLERLVAHYLAPI